MTETEWLAATKPEPMLEFLRDGARDRKQRLFACACCRRIWDLLTTPCSRAAVEVAERFADGLSGEQERASAFADAIHEANGWANCSGLIDAAYSGGVFAAAFAVATAGTIENTGNAFDITDCQFPQYMQSPTLIAAFNSSIHASSAAGAWVQACQDGTATEEPQREWETATLAVGAVQAATLGVTQVTTETDAYEVRQQVQVVEEEAQCDLLRCIFGNPFRPVAFDPKWRSETVVALAAAIYEERAFDRLPILADALEEAGCDHADVLSHCRGDGPHARGCWVVDGVLGKV
jgi:hypothetical protein